MSEPRFLTEEEKIQIVEVIPYIKSSSSENGNFLLQQIRNRVYEQLSEYKINPLAIPLLKNKIIVSFQKSQILAGSKVGIMAVEALSQAPTQMALNSFHGSGVLKTFSGGIQGLKSLIFLTHPKRFSTAIFFNNRNYSFEEILTDKVAEMVQVNLEELVLNVDFISFSPKNSLEGVTIQEESPWYSLFIGFYGYPFDKEDYKTKIFLRLTIDADLLYVHKISPSFLRERILIGTTKKGNNPMVSLVFSPILVSEKKNIVFLDIFAKKNQLIGYFGDLSKKEGKTFPTKDREGNLVSNAEMLFLQNIIYKNTKSIQIKGIPGITVLYPISIPIWSIISEEIFHEDYWELKFNKILQLDSGITPKEIEKLLLYLGIEKKNISFGKDRVFIKLPLMPIDYPLGEKYTPGKILGYLSKKNTEREKQLRNAKLTKNQLVDFEQLAKEISAFEKATKISYAMSEGSNLDLLFGRSDIDSRFCYNNDVNTIFNKFGIEAARNFLIREINNCFSGTYVNPRHVILLGDLMTFSGLAIEVGMSGIINQTQGALSRITVQQTMETLEQTGGTGAIDTLKGISAAILTGTLANMGQVYRSEADRKLRISKKEIEEMDNLEVKDLEDALKSIAGENLATIPDLPSVETEVEPSFSEGEEEEGEAGPFAPEGTEKSNLEDQIAYLSKPMRELSDKAEIVSCEIPPPIPTLTFSENPSKSAIVNPIRVIHDQ